MPEVSDQLEKLWKEFIEYTFNDAKVFITGAAGFIGSYVSRTILENEALVTGLDNLDDYYDAKLKKARLSLLEPYRNFSFVQGDLADADLLFELFRKYKPDIAINLAARAGVRYSIMNRRAYINSNIIGF